MSLDTMLDHRARLEHQRLEAAERRDRALRDQSSILKSASARISAWEHLHHLRLPTDPSHAILRHVAKQTELTLDEVLEVQRMRSMGPTP